MTTDPMDVFRAIAIRVNGPMDDVLQPRLFQLRVSELTRGGFGASSIPEGSRSAEHPIPVTQPVAERDSDGYAIRWGQIGPSDAFDRALQKAEREHRRLLTETLRLLDRLHVLEHSILDAAEPLPEEQKLPCANPHCSNEHTRGKPNQLALCDRCRQWKKRHDADYPKIRETA